MSSAINATAELCDEAAKSAPFRRTFVASPGLAVDQVVTDILLVAAWPSEGGPGDYRGSMSLAAATH